MCGVWVKTPRSFNSSHPPHNQKYQLRASKYQLLAPPTPRIKISTPRTPNLNSSHPRSVKSPRTPIRLDMNIKRNTEGRKCNSVALTVCKYYTILER